MKLSHIIVTITFLVLLLVITIFMYYKSNNVEGFSYQVEINNYKYIPDTLSIKKDDTVIWTNKHNIAHTVTDRNLKFDSNTLKPNETFSYTFKEPGKYDYYCRIHPSVEGKIEVI